MMVATPISLTILRQGQTLAMDVAEGEPLVQRGELPVEARLLADIGEELARITALANTRTALSAAGTPALAHPEEGTLHALQRLGRFIFAHLFPPSVQQRLISSPPTALFLRLHDQLVHVPWELAFDGQEFLLTRFRIGRQVITHHRPAADHATLSPPPEVLKMLLVADPTDELPAAMAEADYLCDLLDTCPNLEVSLLAGRQLRKIDLLQALPEYDLVHYAGQRPF